MVEEHPVVVRNKSRLECLPVELIQDIFLRCLEINLTRVSIHITRALSHPTIYTWLIRLAFGSADNLRDKPFQVPGFIPPQVDLHSLRGTKRQDLRNVILQCRWCTLPLMRKCQREFIEHVIRFSCQGLQFSSKDYHLLNNISSRFDDLASYEKALDGLLGQGDFRLRAKPTQPEHGNKEVDYKLTVWFNIGAVHVSKAGQANVDGESFFELPFCGMSCLPDKLLSPPWTESKLEFLELLATRAWIDEDESYSRASRVLRQVLRDRDFATFKRLLALTVQIKSFRFPIPWPVLPIHFNAALKYAEGEADPFVCLLVEKRWESIPDKNYQLKDKLLAKIGVNWRGF